ncbi:MAG: DUF1446 domain-containing protein [Proteobacteria bacterium]|nr:DUF1446 domain-containing protein [Pseudomonadota bacterium]
MKLPEYRILSPTAILGYGFPESSFNKGIARRPNLIAVDAGSTDPGPYYLGSGKSFTDRAMVKRDLRYILTNGIRGSIPVVIGTAGGAGAKPHLLWCRKIVEEIASEEKLSFKLGIIQADIEKETVLKALQENKIEALRYVPELTPEIVEESINIVAQMGTEPITRALNRGCHVVLAGRCYDPAVFAALPIDLGYDPGPALHLGKILECAAIAATPGSGSDCVMGVLKKDSFILEPLSDERIFTSESTAAHTLYEKSDPYHLPGPGGSLNLENCIFEEIDGGRVEVRGSRFQPSDRHFVKLEGVRKIGYRSISIAGVRDPVMVENIDTILSDVKRKVESLLENQNLKGRVHFHVYGKNGVMGTMEPLTDVSSHELGIVTEVLCSNENDAETVCSMIRSTLLHYGYPGRIATAGNLAFPFSPSDVNMGEAFEFSIYHLMEADERNLFQIETLDFLSQEEEG